VVPGAPSSVTVALSPDAVTAGGRFTVRGTVADAEGNGVPGVAVQVAVGGASLATATTAGDGSFSLAETAPSAPGSYTVKAEVTGAPPGVAALTVSAAAGAAGGGGVATLPAGGGNSGLGGAAPAPPAANTDSPPQNTPVDQTGSSVTESVNTATGPVVVATAGATLRLELPEGSMPQGTRVEVIQVDPGTLPATPRDTEVASPVWSVSTAGVEPTAPVPAVFHVSLPPGISPDQLGLYTLAGGSWRFVTGGSVDPSTDTLAATLPHLSTWAVLVEEHTFADVPPTSWAFRAVEELTAAGVVSGLPGGGFGPDQSVTRAAFLKMLLGVVHVAPRLDLTQPFSDVAPSDWYAGYADAAEAVGLLQGDGGQALLEQPVTREEAAVLLMRAASVAHVSPSRGGAAPVAQIFTDQQSIGSWAAADVAAARAAGFLQGYPDGSFRPLAPLTRAEAASLAAQLAVLVAAAAPSGGA
jgi:hypothetical protein